jgi:hypothetical protein
MTKFNVVINPFSQKILVSARVNKMSCDEVLDWNGESDSWYTFEMNGNQFMIHLLYEDELFVEVYDDNGDTISSPHPTIFKIIYKDEF